MWFIATMLACYSIAATGLAVIFWRWAGEWQVRAREAESAWYEEGRNTIECARKLNAIRNERDELRTRIEKFRRGESSIETLWVLNADDNSEEK